MLRPWVEVRERYSGIAKTFWENKNMAEDSRSAPSKEEIIETDSLVIRWKTAAIFLHEQQGG
jgi:hypothetical protein